MAEQVKTTTSSLWRKLAACYELLKVLEESSLVLMATYYVTSDQLDQINLGFIQLHQLSALDYLASTLMYLKAEKIQEAMILEEVYDYYKKLPSRNESDLDPASGKSNFYLLELELCHGKLCEVHINLWGIAREAVHREVWVSRRTLAVGVVILTAVLLASPVLVLLVRHTVNTIQTFSRSVEVSTQQLVTEKQKSDLLLSRMLPLPVLRRLRAQRTVPAEAFDAVTIFFSDIVGFTTISANSTPMEVINMLNMLYKLFDGKIMQYNVYKVETIGDAYMVVSGLPQRNGNRHASEIADMSLSLMRSLEGATVPHRPEESLRIRAGVNTGPCVAGVVGTTMPRYCLFGDTINVASRMESTGEAMKIHISDSTKQALDQIGGYEVQSRGVIDVAGKGQMETFWLLGKMGCFQSESPRGPRLHDYDQNFMELLIKS
ncbi:atrial natriuretic peptide receptor 2-like [Pectinophora gossypiella]|uniref:atrial natriuretic peptide receptor 2-like n=1 Tax=Pectinophora gossypiella TaxID=13191 RepID=UPI00214EEC1F|nr:atrial natriuretic peptide receptor 2-like [Pectinophora gossypiella]